MNLVQKLLIGLGLACAMLLSSCSKEGEIAPEAQLDVKAASSLREETGILVLPYFPPTTASTGINSLPSDWQRISGNSNFSNDLQRHPTGTSNLTHLWGNVSFPWEISLPNIPNVQNINSIVTVTTETHIPQPGKRSGVTTKIKHLKPGKKYSLKFYVASTVPQFQGPTILPVTYAKAVIVQMTNAFTPIHWLISEYYDISNSKAAWVAKTINFEATASESEFTFFAETAGEGQYSYAHIFVDKSSIKEMN